MAPALSSHEPIAIVGLGCRFPGAPDPRAFWQLLLDGREAIGEIPRDRFDVDRLFDPVPATPGRIMTRRGGFLDEIDSLDLQAFGLSPREAVSLDPQHRLLLETAWHALEDAGHVWASSQARTGVFIGLWLSEYESRLFRDPHAIDFHATLGSGRYAASGRLSHYFGFEGPSLTVDTACSSSLVAIHLACQSLRSGECDSALAGGANVILEPFITLAYSQARMMAQDGRCKFGDADGDGYVRSDGAGVIVLKRLSRALADGDRIYALIRGSSVNNDGASRGFFGTPAQGGQEAMLARAYADAGVNPAEVGYVEAHGTGTLAGDPVELGALATVLGAAREDGSKCYVGSVKTNIGHTESAAGVAGLIKTTLSLTHDTIPASLHFRTPNPTIDWARLPITIPVSSTPWKSGTRPRFAGVSGFGISGTNAHIVLQDWNPLPEVPKPAAPSRTTPRPQLLPLSAHHASSLQHFEASVAEWLQSQGNDQPSEAPLLSDICYTASVRRMHRAHRCAVVASSAAVCASSLSGDDTVTGATVVRGIADHDPRKIVFVFPGQGSQWLGMGQTLFAHEPVFREAMDRCDAAIRAEAGWSPNETLHLDASSSRLGEIDVVQPVLFAMSVALAALWQSWGVRPDAVVGHSMGEVAAAHTAGILTLEDAVAVIARRSRLLRRVSGRGAMAVVDMPAAEVSAAIADVADRVALAVSNSPRTSVLSGDPATIDALIERFEAQDQFCRRVNVDVASHSPQMDALLPDLEAALAALRPQPGTIPFYSTVTATPLDPTTIDATYWGRNLRQPVRFGQAVELLLRDGHVTFVEMSPHPLLVSAVQEAARAASRDTVIAVGSTRRNEDERATMLEGLAEVYVRGHDVMWQALHPTGGHVVSLPPYCWQRERCWYDSPSPSANVASASRDVRPVMPGAAMPSAVHAGTFFWNFDLSLSAWPELRDHRVRGRVLVPATALLELAGTAARQILGDTATLRFEHVTFDAALDLAEDTQVAVQMVARQSTDDTLAMDILSAGHRDATVAPQWTRHFTCSVSAAHHEATLEHDHGHADASVAVSENTLTSEAHYAALGARGLEYGPAFRKVEWIGRGQPPDTGVDRLIARITTPSAETLSAKAEWLDGALQPLLAALPDRCGTDETYVPVAIASLTLPPSAIAAPGHISSSVVRTGIRGSAEAGREISSEGDAVCIEGDVIVRDSRGTVLAHACGVRLQRVGLNGSRPETFYRTAWPNVASSPATTGIDGQWIVFDDAAGAAAHIADELVRRGGRVTRVATTESPDFEVLVTAAAAAAPIHGIVHCRALDLPEPSSGAADWEGAQARMLLEVLAVAQACARTALRLPGGLAFVTRGAQRVVDTDATMALAQSPLCGFNSVLRAEHPELRSATLDLDPAEDHARNAILIVQEQAAGLPDDTVAWRAGMRHAARLERFDATTTASDSVPSASPRRSSDARFRASLRQPGVLDHLEAVPLPRAQLGAQEVEIEVEATGLNFMNVLAALGSYPGHPQGAGPLGIECAGRVVARGTAVTDLAIGDEVFGVAFDSLASHAVTDRRLVLRRPAALSAEQAAGVPIAFLTAHYALTHLARLRAGERLLIHSAAGGVGLAAVQLARRAGAEIVATAGTAAKRQWLRDQGIAHVFDSRSRDWAEAVLAATHGEGVDVVLNSLAGDAVPRGLSVLRSHGRFVEIGRRDIAENRQMGLAPFQKNLSYMAVDLDRMARERPDMVGALFGEVVDLLNAGAIAPVSSRTFPIAQAIDAFREMAQGHHTGKLVITMRDSSLPASSATPDALAAAVGGTVLITGGFGALGLSLAGRLVRRGIDHLALVGRSGPRDEARPLIDQWRSAGVTVREFTADIADGAALDDILQDVRRSMPPLSGVIHSAGALDDRTLLGQDRDSFHRVLRPKIAGAWALHRLTLTDPIEFFVLMGSVASFLGLPGQSNYAAGNAFLDGLAHYRQVSGQPALCVSWGPWSRIGLASAREERGERLSAQGLHSITPEQGGRAFEQLLCTSHPRAALMRFDAERWRNRAGTASLPILSTLAADVIDAGPPGAAADVRSASPSSLHTTLADAAPAERRDAMERWLREQLAQVLRQPAGRIGRSTPFRSLGLDSLMGLELRNRIETSGGVVLPVTAIWNHPTIARLALEIARRLQVSFDESVPLPPTVAASVTPISDPDDDVNLLARLIDAVESLSDDEAARKLQELS